jgi:hypothetical protein
MVTPGSTIAAGADPGAVADVHGRLDVGPALDAVAVAVHDVRLVGEGDVVADDDLLHAMMTLPLLTKTRSPMRRRPPPLMTVGGGPTRCGTARR